MTVYDAAFYDLIRDEARRSAAALGPLLYERFAPRTVIDVGCGEGWWGYELQRCGCDVLGVDGHDGAGAVIHYEQVDLAQPFTVLGPGRLDTGGWDMVVCLEVAEHLPADRADSFVADLCALAPGGVVVFSAAFPGQGGIGHLNEQPPGYWADLFREQGRAVSGALRWAIWDDDRIAPYYRSNLLLADTAGNLDDPTVGPWFNHPAADPIAVVHPVTFAHVRAALDPKGRRR